MTPRGPHLVVVVFAPSPFGGALTPCMMVTPNPHGLTGVGLALRFVPTIRRRDEQSLAGSADPGARTGWTPPTGEARHKRPMGRPQGPGWKERARSSPEVGLCPTSIKVRLCSTSDHVGLRLVCFFTYLVPAWTLSQECVAQSGFS